MDEHQVVWNEKVAEKIIKNLENRRMAGSYTASAATAKDEILEMIPHGATVFRCGSMTAGGLGLWEAIAAIPGVKLIDPYQPELSREEGLELRRQGLTADVMVASTNAITLARLHRIWNQPLPGSSTMLRRSTTFATGSKTPASKPACVLTAGHPSGFAICGAQLKGI